MLLVYERVLARGAVVGAGRERGGERVLVLRPLGRQEAESAAAALVSIMAGGSFIALLGRRCCRRYRESALELTGSDPLPRHNLMLIVRPGELSARQMQSQAIGTTSLAVRMQFSPTQQAARLPGVVTIGRNGAVCDPCRIPEDSVRSNRLEQWTILLDVRISLTHN